MAIGAECPDCGLPSMGVRCGCKDAPPVVDWTPFDGDPEGNVTCGCMYADLKDGDFVPSFRSHYKYVRTDSFAGVVTRKPCPKCGSHTNISSVRGDWERA